MLSSSPKSVAFIQYSTTIIALAGLWFVDFTLANCLILFIGYFLYCGIGVSLTYHRYYTHKSFEFRHPILKWVCTWFALMAGRGGVLGWVYIHRLHHRSTDTVDDPHYSSLTLTKMWFPDYKQFINDVNLRIIKDLLNKTNTTIDKYYNLLILFWAIFLLTISVDLFYFGWVVPVVLTHFSFNSFLYAGHRFGYRNHETRDQSTNCWPYAILLFGEGWHNNHHKNPRQWNLRERWWEIDITSLVIRLLKSKESA
jgi:stearoyl-CoA desaturase (delta-9 desaturase)